MVTIICKPAGMFSLHEVFVEVPRAEYAAMVDKLRAKWPEATFSIE